MRLSSLAVVALCSTACSPGLAGSWIGDMDCGGLLYDLEFDISKETGKTFAGDGVQERDFTNAAGQSIQEMFTFDLDFDLEKAGGAQFVNADLTCTSWNQVVDGNQRPQTCVADRFSDWTVEWDGKDRLDIETGFGCEATLDR